MDETRLQVTEIFSSIQGESTWSGCPCTFVRLSGCPLCCRWCDTGYARDGGGTWMSSDEIIESVKALGLGLVEITGGEPLAQPGSIDLMRRLADERFTVLLETSGAFPIEPVDPRVHRIMDLKCPGSGMERSNRLENLGFLRPGDELKLVVADRADYEWARSMLATRAVDPGVEVLFAAVHPALEPAELASWILRDRLRARLQVQLHRVLWPQRERGV
ncbi:MAG: radical SAM protein [Candidatus Riflebacteria bacterium]|nr:radical SAM protein [Candidatus Riflebacteria bacterium]